MKVYIETYGCTLNRADSDSIKAVLLRDGHAVVETPEDADVVLLNTCTVKGPTQNKIVERIKRLREKGHRLVIAGCLVVNGELIKRIAPESPLLWPSARGYAADAVDDASAGKATEFRESSVPLERMLTAPIARIPISEGCTGSCNFCQTKLARPLLRSERESSIITNIRNAVVGGAKEIQLTAMDTGAYGFDRGTDLIGLMGSINSLECDFLARLGMINPNHAARLRTKLVDGIAGRRFYRFLHMPVQSGSLKVLKEMNRPHTVRDFEGLTVLARKMLDDASIATDIIVGFPTETDDDFDKTLRLLERYRPDVVNISRFSPRPGTKAAAMKQLPVETVRERSRRLRELVQKTGLERNRKMIGKKEEVLVTEKQQDFTGRTRSYRQVAVKDFKGKLGEKVKVKITGATHCTLIGRV